MANDLKSQSDENKTITTTMDLARYIWLAGLGAFTKAEKEGSKIFDMLVKEGEDIESQSIKMAGDRVEDMKDKVEDMKDKANETWDRLEQVFQDRIAQVLNKLNIPTYGEIRELSKRVEELNENVKELTKKSGP